MMPLLFIWRKFPTDRWKHVNPALRERRNSGWAEENGSAQINRVLSSLRKHISAVLMPAKMTKEGRGFPLPQGCVAQSPCQLAVKSFSYARTGPRPLWWQKSIKSHELQVSVLLFCPSQFLTVLVGLALLCSCPLDVQPTVKLPTSNRWKKTTSPRCHSFPLRKISTTFLTMCLSAHFVSTEALFPDSSINSHFPCSQSRCRCFLFFLWLTHFFLLQGRKHNAFYCCFYRVVSAACYSRLCWWTFLS